MKLLHPLLRRFAGGLPGQISRAGRGKVSVEKKKRLLRNRRLVAHGDVNVGVGKVKRPECAGQKLAIHHRINRAPHVSCVEKFARLAAHGQVKPAAGREHRIAKLFKFQAVNRKV